MINKNKREKIVEGVVLLQEAGLIKKNRIDFRLVKAFDKFTHKEIDLFFQFLIDISFIKE
jgi:hypothetical protein